VSRLKSVCAATATTFPGPSPTGAIDVQITQRSEARKLATGPFNLVRLPKTRMDVVGQFEEQVVDSNDSLSLEDVAGVQILKGEGCVGGAPGIRRAKSDLRYSKPLNSGGTSMLSVGPSGTGVQVRLVE